MKISTPKLWIVCCGLLLGLLLMSCNRCRETICQECIAWSDAGEEVYYGELCHVSKSERRRNERKARKAAEQNDGFFECHELVQTTGCD